MLVPYYKDESYDFYKKYYEAQVGSGLSVYRGKTYVPQTGNGIGAILASLAKKALPIAKSVGRGLLREGVNVANDLMAGETFTSSAKKRFSNVGNDLLEGFASSPKKRKRVSTKNKAAPQGKKRKRTYNDTFS